MTSAASRYRFAGAVALGVALFSSLAYADEVKAGDIAVLDAWSRATPARAGGAFLTIRNDGATADRLTGVSSDAAPMAGIHESKEEGGVMQMRPVDGIDVPAHGTVALKPGGYHIMLMGLTKPLKPGETFPVTLTFAHAGKVTVNVAVKAAGESESMDMKSMGHDSKQ